MRTSRLATMVVAVALVAPLAACGEESESAAAHRRLCDATDRVNEALRDFTRTEEENEAEELARARDELFDAMAEWSHASSDVARAEGAEEDDPVTGLNEDLESIPDDATLTEVAQGMSTSAGNFLEGVKAEIVGRDC